MANTSTKRVSLTDSSAGRSCEWRRRIRIGRPVAALGGLALLAATATAEAIIINGSSGLVGVTAGQTLRLAIAHVGNPNDSSMEPCIVEWAFFDLAGAVVGSGEARVEPGRGVLADLRAAEIGPHVVPGDRLEIRAEIRTADSDRDATFCQNNLRPTLQVFDDETGRTAILVDPQEPHRTGTIAERRK
jgi:hypothetical protein